MHNYFIILDEVQLIIQVYYYKLLTGNTISIYSFVNNHNVIFTIILNINECNLNHCDAETEECTMGGYTCTYLPVYGWNDQGNA